LLPPGGPGKETFLSRTTDRKKKTEKAQSHTLMPKKEGKGLVLLKGKKNGAREDARSGKKGSSSLRWKKGEKKKVGKRKLLDPFFHEKERK